MTVVHHGITARSFVQENDASSLNYVCDSNEATIPKICPVTPTESESSTRVKEKQKREAAGGAARTTHQRAQSENLPMTEPPEASTDTPHRDNRSFSSGRSYAYAAWHRSLAYALTAGAVLVAGVAAWFVVSGREDAAAFGILTVLIGMNALQTTTEFLSTFRLTGESLRIERPFAGDQEVRYADIERVLIGGMAVEVHVASDAPGHVPGRTGPDVQISRDIQDVEDFLRLLVDHLTPAAVVENPSGEFAELRRPGRAASRGDADAD
jgi:hypothetical protein